MTSPGYLRYPHINGDLVTFTAEDDVWLAPASGGRAWKLSADGASVSSPRFSPDGSMVAWTSWRDRDPEVYTVGTDGASAARLTYWGDWQTRTTGWTSDNEVLAISAAGTPGRQYTWAYAIPFDAPPRRLPFGPVADLAFVPGASALLTGRLDREPAHWKRYRGGTRGRLWTANGDDPLFSRVLARLDGQFSSPMLIGGRLAFLADHEGTANIYSCALDGTDLRRHTSHDGFYARNAATDGQRIVYHVAADIWILDSLEAGAEPRRLDITLGSSAAARAPKLITAADHLGEMIADQAGQASVVEVRGTVHWLTHAEGPARALSVDPRARARLPRPLGDTGKVIWVTDADRQDALETASVSGDPADPAAAAPAARLFSGELGYVTDLAPSPDGRLVAVAAHDGRLILANLESGQLTELAASDDGRIRGLAWSPDSDWLAWSQPGPRPLARIRLAHVTDATIVDVTDGRFADTEPVFTLDGLYLAFLSRRTFDPVYDVHAFDLSFPFGSRPYLVPLAAETLSPFGPRPGGRPVTPPDNSKSDDNERTRLTVDTEGLPSRVVSVPVDEGRYFALAAVKGGLAWLRARLSGVLGEGFADLDEDRPRPALERFDLRKRETSVLASEVNWFGVSGDGSRLVIRDGSDVRVVPADRKADNGSSDDVISVDLSRARYLADPASLWEHAFDEAGRIIRREYWTPTMSDVDWEGVLDAYRPLLDRIRTSAEFSDLLWEVAGELGTSHAYVSASGQFRAQASRGAAVGLLGADLTRSADGRWLVERVLPGESSDPLARSPLAAPGVAVRPGDEVIEVDGRPVDPVHGPWPLLAATAGKPVELTVRAGAPPEPGAPDGDAGEQHAAAGETAGDSAGPGKAGPEASSQAAPQPRENLQPHEREPGGEREPGESAGADAGTDKAAGPEPGESGDAGQDGQDGASPRPRIRRVVVVPLHDDRRLRYQDCVAGRRRFVRERSDGRLGYLHIPDMMGEGWAHLHRDLRSEMGRDALIVDVRGNRGGHTSQLIVEKLARRIIGWDYGRYLRPESYPEDAPRGPVVAMADEFAGSDGDIVTAAIRILRLGPVVGARTWGGVIGIDGWKPLVDGTHITVPRYAFWFGEYGWGVENHGVEPDIEVLITPDDWAAGRDPQLEVAIDTALTALAERPAPALPDPLTGPSKRRPPLPPR